MSVKTRFLIWAVIVHLLMIGLCIFAFRNNLAWLLCSILCVAATAGISVRVWYGLSKSDKVSTMCLDMLNEQDFSSQLRHVGYPEGDRIIDVYNRMI
jgi:ACR3 family arsenite efflux pump ArsB